MPPMFRGSSSLETHIPMSRLSRTRRPQEEVEVESHTHSVFSNPLRRSITADPRSDTPTYRNSFPNASTPAIPSPSPLYGGENDDLPPSRFKILPREEEGREELPPYTCSLHREAMFERKMELQSPFERAHKRRWKKCYLVLHGTKLEVHKARKIPWFARGLKKADPSKPAGWRAGPLLESYTLQLGEVGTATDYKKRHFAIRLRVQAVQFLISCRTLESYLDWLEALSAAIDVSPSLEERSLPRYQTLPRRRRRRVVVTADTAAPLTTTTTGATASADAAQQQLDNIANSLQLTPNRGVTPAAAGTTQPAVRSTAAEPEEHAFDEAGKWAPQSRITREANMRFARRCMAVLCADSPRQSEFVVVKGKRYRIMWETKKMVPAEAEADAPVDDANDRPPTMKGANGITIEDLSKLPRYEEVFGEMGMGIRVGVGIAV